MTKVTSSSSAGLPTQGSGATDSLWQPSWLHWLISALSGTVEIEKQTAWLKKNNEELRKGTEEMKKNNEELRKGTEEMKKSNEELKKSNEELKKSNEELKKSNEEWLKCEQQKIEVLRKENERLAELESRLDAVLHRSASSSIQAQPTDKD